MLLLREVPWQQAVYTRPTSRDRFQFSHARHIHIKKAFMPDLSVRSQKRGEKLKAFNIERLRSFPVLILVTGNWAQEVSLESYTKVKGQVHKLNYERFDHLERLGAAAMPALSSEVSKSYRVLQYHCSVATYEAGPKHEWPLTGVSPMLSDMVLLPRILREDRLQFVIASFSRAVRKTLKDSLILAGERRYKEDTWELKTTQSPALAAEEADACG
jgi:hypothetical protein